MATSTDLSSRPAPAGVGLAVADLVDAAGEVAAEFGRVPGRAELVRLLGIDADTAGRVLGELLTDDGTVRA